MGHQIAISTLCIPCLPPPPLPYISLKMSLTYHVIDFLHINLLKLSFVPDVFRVLVFIDPLLNQVSAVQPRSIFIRVFRICLILRHECPAAPGEDNLDAISMGILNKLYGCNYKIKEIANSQIKALKSKSNENSQIKSILIKAKILNGSQFYTVKYLASGWENKKHHEIITYSPALWNRYRSYTVFYPLVALDGLKILSVYFVAVCIKK